MPFSSFMCYGIAARFSTQNGRMRHGKTGHVRPNQHKVPKGTGTEVGMKMGALVLSRVFVSPVRIKFNTWSPYVIKAGE